MLLKNAKIVTLAGEFETDVRIEDGKIVAIGRTHEEGIDLSGHYLLPALIDLNVRPMDNKVSVASFEELSQEAMRGGVGTLALMPDLTPAICDEIALEFVRTQRSAVDILPLITALTDKQMMSEIAILLKKGALSIYLSSDTNPYLLARIFEYAKMHGKPIHIEPKNALFRDVGVMNEGELSFRLGLGGISKLEEHAEVAKIIQYSEYYNVPVLFKAVSTAKALAMIAKSPLCYAEVSIHHLLLSDEACEGYNTYAKLSPPLREESERQKLLEALQKGWIDTLTALHSPKSHVSKDLSFDEASFGIDALGYFLPLAYTLLVRSGVIDMCKLIELVSTNPACFVGEKIGKVQEGYWADLVVFVPHAYKDETTLYKHVLYGDIKALMKRGKIVWGGLD